MLITNAGSKTIFVDSSTSSGYSNTLTVSDLILAGQTGSMNTLLIDNIGSTPALHILNSLIINPGGALLTATSGLVVDNAAGGAVDVEGSAELSGTNFLSGGLYVSFSSNTAASVSLIDGQTTLTNGYVTIGFYGSAQVELLSGTLQTEDNISAPNAMYVGLGGGSQGTLSIPGGTLLVPEHLSIGEDTNSSGLLTLNGGQVIATNNFLLSIGGNATGQVVVSSGQLAASYVIVGDAMGSSGMLTLAGGTVSISGAMAIAQGQGATGSVFITGGQLLVTNQSVTIGGFGIGQVALSNGSFLAQSVIISDSENSQGTLTIAGGTVSVSNMIAGAFGYIGTATNANASGTIEIIGGSLTITNQFGTGLLTIGQQGNGFLVQNGGLVQVDQVAIATGIASNATASFCPESNLYVRVGLGQVTVSNGTLLARSLGVGVGSPGTLTIAGGTVSVSSNLVIGVASNVFGGVAQIFGGNLNVTNQSGAAQLVVGVAGMGTFAQSGGVVTVDQLLVTNGTYNVTSNQFTIPPWIPVTNGTPSTFDLAFGVFNAMSANVSNTETFFIGDGIDPATYNLLGGIHSFANGLEVRNNAILSGCGTINGSVVVDAGGTMLADCGGTLTFTGIVTNNGSWKAIDGSVLEFYGPVVNNGVINVLDGNTNFHAGFINNGVVVASNSIPQIVSIAVVGSGVEITFTTSSSPTYVLEFTSDLIRGTWNPLIGFTGMGGDVTLTDFEALSKSQRFYRVQLVVPP
jgi:fibronectin-binding autotransporter adhesin